MVKSLICFGEWDPDCSGFSDMFQYIHVYCKEYMCMYLSLRKISSCQQQ